MAGRGYRGGVRKLCSLRRTVLFYRVYAMGKAVGGRPNMSLESSVCACPATSQGSMRGDNRVYPVPRTILFTGTHLNSPGID
jgi:hypothetical protein